MRVLHLPTNIASQMQVTVEALRDLGIEARGLAGPVSGKFPASLELLPHHPSGSWPGRKWCAARRYARILRAIAWADVVHWHYTSALFCDADLRLAAALGKKGFVEFWGSDIRDPEIEAKDNPWFVATRDTPGYECSCESSAHSRDIQRRFAARGCRLFIPSPGMVPYVRPEYYPEFRRTAPRIHLHSFTPAFPPETNGRPLVVHAPTAPVAKGSRFVFAAVEQLREEFDFDFQLVTGMTHAESLSWMRRCDIFVDQLITGEYGLAAVEAMAFGKPVICFVKPSVAAALPAHLPVVSANPESVTDVLRSLLRDSRRRRRIGEAGRAWVEEHHDAVKVVRQIADYYQAA